ncbi:FecR family protein [Mucilaginibacter ximonensis]|uniref:FecR family protein n=1 Tax=Mucilaginibacter ximonensis TaxID=538021 RepID=A0ABW5Y8M6_9SPHI
MDKELFKNLIHKVENGTATDEELSTFNAYMNRLSTGQNSAFSPIENEDAIRDEMWANLQAAITPVKTRRLNWYIPVGIAAVLLLGISIGIHFLTANPTPEKEWQAQVDHDIKPLGNAATLTLANGKKIILTNRVGGVLAVQQNAVIHQTAGGQISYTDADKSRGSVAFDTLTTPSGAVYNLKLGDGTTVWLNASTSLRFPESFPSGKRELQLLYGEAYFEVAHRANAPFSVRTTQGLVEDIGTHFNIRAYADEPTEKTTLLEGSVRITAQNKIQAKLVHGQQAQLNHTAVKSLNVINVDLDEIMAWKNGLFLFDNEKLSSIMKKIAGWYNVKVAYQNDAIKNEVFYGSISRFKNVSEVMDMLERTGNSHFELKNNVIFIKPKQ